MYFLYAFALLLVGLTACSCQENETSLFQLINPERGLLTTFYGKPPTFHQILLYTEVDLRNASVAMTSSKTSVATVPERVTITTCTHQANVSRPENGSNKGYGNLNGMETCYNLSFYSNAVYIGYSTLKFYTSINSSDSDVYIGQVLLRSIQPWRRIDLGYRISVTALVVVVMLGIGNDLNFQTIKEHLKKPKAPVIALISQFTIMPLISYGIIWLMGYTGGKALGFFTLGCSPGGGTSNIYAKLSNGDLSLSVTMTTLSTIASLGMLPLWLYTLGTTIPGDEGLEEIKIPFFNILQSLAVIVVPLGIGALMKYKLPRVALVIKRWLNVLFLLALIFFLTFVVYVKLYVFVEWDIQLVLAACSLPYGGYLLGGLFAWICRFDWKLIKTISIETGMQSAAVCYLVVMSVSGQPDSDLAIILPTISTIVAGWPFYIILPIYKIREKLKNRKKAKKEKGFESDESLADEKLSASESEDTSTLDSSSNEKKRESKDCDLDVEMSLIKP